MDLRLVALNRVAALCHGTAQEVGGARPRVGTRKDFVLRGLWHDGRAGIGYVAGEAFVGLRLDAIFQMTAADTVPAGRRSTSWPA